MKRCIYADYAATTPLMPEALEAMLPFMKGDFGNPSSIQSCAAACTPKATASRRTTSLRR